MSEHIFYENGLNFSCQQCSFCCKGFPGVVLLSQLDLERFAKWADVTTEQFILMYCRWIESDDGLEYLSLRERKNMECIFWKNGCEAYEARPTQCRTYPFWTNVLQDSSTWETESKDCPGINRGTLHTCDEINEQLSKYKSREPITRKKN